jgi:flagellar hook assembly protein FlgD
MQLVAVQTTGVPDGPPAGIALAAPSPNPALGTVTLRFTLPHEQSVSLAIYDASGRRVRELASGARPAGQHSLAWDLHDETGHAVGAGLYFARLETGGRVVTQRFSALR